jgi:hypothetical protein
MAGTADERDVDVALGVSGPLRVTLLVCRRIE